MHDENPRNSLRGILVDGMRFGRLGHGFCDVGDGMTTVDEFNGDTPHLIRCIEALLSLDASGSLVPHGIGGHARTMLSAAAVRLAALASRDVTEEPVMPEAATTEMVDAWEEAYQNSPVGGGHVWAWEDAYKAMRAATPRPLPLPREEKMREARNAALEEAAKLIEEGFDRGIARKVDTCAHGKYGWEDCESCAAAAIRALSAEHGKVTE
jgi:hypothetical protein